MTAYTLRSDSDGYCWTISSAVLPASKAYTTVSRETRVPDTRITSSGPVVSGGDFASNACICLSRTIAVGADPGQHAPLSDTEPPFGRFARARPVDTRLA